MTPNTPLRTALTSLILAFIVITPAAALNKSPEATTGKTDHYAKNPETVRLIHENLERAGINTNPYEFLPEGPDGTRAEAGTKKRGAAYETKAPKGYKPFYISHYGRHGSRSDWAGSKYPWVTEKYNALENEGLLTEDGKTAVERVKEIIALHGGMDGRLTQRGQDEHRQMRISGWRFSFTESAVAFAPDASSSRTIRRKSFTTVPTVPGTTCPKMCLSIWTATASMQQPRQATLLTVKSPSGEVSPPSGMFRCLRNAS
jgi:hypothetical protein